MAPFKISLLFEIKYLTVSTAVDRSQAGILLLQSIQITDYRHLRKTWRWMKHEMRYSFKRSRRDSPLQEYPWKLFAYTPLHEGQPFAPGQSHRCPDRQTYTIHKWSFYWFLYTMDHSRHLVNPKSLTIYKFHTDSYLPLSRALASSVMASPCARFFAQMPRTATLCGDDLCSLTSKGWWHRQITRLRWYWHTLYCQKYWVTPF